MKLENYIVQQKTKGGIWELLAVILQINLQFVNDNFIKEGKFTTKGIFNPIVLYRIAVHVIKIINAIRLYKSDYVLFQSKYLNPIEYNLEKLNSFLT